MKLDIKSIPVKSFIFGLVLVVLAYSSIYTVDQKDVGIIKRSGKAVSQVDPGIHIKIPFIDTVVPMEVRTKKYSITLTASTTGRSPIVTDESGNTTGGIIELQMPSRVKISANWSIPRSKALKVYKDYGSLGQYEKRILDPKFTNAVKQSFSHYDIESIISDRETVRQEVENTLTGLLGESIAVVSAINIEDVMFHQKISDAVTKKQVAKLQLQEQRDILAKQDLEAQESTNIDSAKAAGIKLISIQKAAATAREGLAEAEAITAKAKALSKNAAGIIELTKAQRWNGSHITTLMGANAQTITDLRGKIN